MFLLGAFLAGYYLGTKAGPDGMGALVETGRKVVTSEEFRSAVAGVVGVVRGVVSQVGAAREERKTELRAV